MSNRKVHIYQIGSDFHAFPPVVVLEGGDDKVRFINTTDENLLAAFPADVFDAAAKDVVIKKKGEKDSPKVKSQGSGNFKVTTYKITVTSAMNKRVKGNSDPVIIIEN